MEGGALRLALPAGNSLYKSAILVQQGKGGPMSPRRESSAPQPRASVQEHVMLETLSPESRPLGGSGILVSPIAWACGGSSR